MLVGPDWLWCECHRDRSHAPTARIIYTALIRVANRLGHIIDLDREESRRQVMHGLRNHRIPTCMAPCARCGCLAWLKDWIKAGDMSTPQKAAILADNPEVADAGRLDFLLPCPGGGYKQVTYENTQPPEVL